MRLLRLRNSSLAARFAAMVAFALVGLVAGEVAAQRTAAVLPFEGRGPAPRVAQRQVQNALDGQISLVPMDDVEQAIERTNADPDSAEGIAAIAQELNADLVIAGTVRGRGRRARTTITVYDNQGERVAREVSRGRGGAGSAAQEALGVALGVLEERDRASEPEPEPDPGPPIDDEPIDDEPVEPVSPPGALPLLVALGGITARTRSAEVCLAPDGCPDQARFYSSGLFPELSVRFELMPLHSAEGGERGLIFRVDFAFASWLSSQEEDAPDAEPIDTSTLRFEGAAGYLASVGEGALLGGLLGFGIDNFSVDPNTIMPGRGFTYLRLAPLVRVDLAGPQLYLEAEIAYRLGLGASGITELVFGTAREPGTWASSASASGFDLGAGLGGRLESGLSYGLRFSWVRYGVSFTGAGMNPDGAQARDGSDSGIFVALQAGWSVM